MRLPALLLVAVLAAAAPARGEGPVSVPMRVGTHPDLGRVVFDWPRRVGYAVEEEAGRVVIRFAEPARIDLAAARRPPRNVLTIGQDGDAVAMRITPGARLRHFRLGNRIVIDLRDPAAAQPSAQRPPERAAAPSTGVARPSAEPSAPRVPTPATPTPERPAALPQAAPAAVRALSEPSALTAPPRPAAPVAAPIPAAPAPNPSPALQQDIAASLPAPGTTRFRLVHGAPGIVFDAGADAAIAMFRRGDRVHLVVDRAITPDLAALHGHPVFGRLESQPAGDATVFSLALPAPARLAARRDGTSWVIEATRHAVPADAPVLRAAADAGPPARLLFTGGNPGQTVAIADPATGETLLVGTLRQPGPAVLFARRLPEFDLLPTMLGAAIVARSDRLRLRALAADRLVLEAAAGAPLGLGMQPGDEPPPAAIAMSRLLELPAGPVPMLLERLRAVLSSVNATPPLTRGRFRRDAAETLLALGMPQEAQAMAAIAFQEDPRSREDPRLLLAHGIAALLSGRPGDAQGIEDPRLPLRDEVTLWRALRALSHGQGTAAALRGSAPLLLGYPEALRARTLPLAIEALASGGEPAAAASLLAAAVDMPGLDTARAMLAEAEGRATEAIVILERLATGRDRRQRAIAVRRLAELRLTAGTIDGAGAADALEQSLYAWRGGDEEVALRRRIAALRIAAGQGQQAFALLDETRRLFPDHAAGLGAPLQEAFLGALETAPPLAAATLFDANPDLLPAGARGEAAVRVLAERVAALDLPDRAAALLRRAMEATEHGPTRAAIGERLGVMRAAGGDAAGTIAALDASESTEIDSALAARRTILRARAMARSGARDDADTLLVGLGPAGAAARAEFRAEIQDWPGAAASMAEHLAATLPPPSAPLTQEHRSAIARQAAYLALAGDEAGLATLRSAQGGRMEGGALAEAFGVLTADPVRGVEDLPRLQRDLGLARLLPTRLEALRAGSQVTR
ncbi:hypothetical protein GXW78_06635 [Roseomonas terrae]|uniref:Tetratricopeptide repeat protein n=1 Tax=Neoroseomonas terrae TaxID=424799 RepID=A0ABS5EE88_9PROT|nr:hypothetical protein [Neoroseomonas terrae]MBR0649331.1 hypothetical protein [Neoroseomonas terrae]